MYIQIKIKFHEKHKTDINIQLYIKCCTKYNPENANIQSTVPFKRQKSPWALTSYHCHAFQHLWGKVLLSWNITDPKSNSNDCHSAIHVTTVRHFCTHSRDPRTMIFKYNHI